MRTPNSICLLCQENRADKENSHIVPKFMTKSILGKSNDKRGYRVHTDNFNHPEIAQDSDKESYLLCSGCEKYFGILETYISNRLHNKIWDIRHSDKFSVKTCMDGTVYKVCDHVDPIVFNLFLYSIIWRCDIASTHTFADFKIGSTESELLRLALRSFTCDQQKKLLERLQLPMGLMPKLYYALITAEYFPDSSMNMMLADELEKGRLFSLILNEYMIVFSFRDGNHVPKFEYLNCDYRNRVNLAVLSRSQWESSRDSVLKSIFQR